jgi:acetate---CoA ligase (ADP-forming)
MARSKNVCNVMDCSALLRPRSIAIVGATERPSAGRSIISSLGKLGFEGAIYPINPNYETILGHRSYASFADVPGSIDLAAFCVGNDRLLDSYRLGVEKGIRAATIYAGGFDEASDDASKRRHAEIVGLSQEAGIALCGPNCMGVFNPASRSSVYLHNITDPDPSSVFGNVGFISQSGSICISMLADCRRYGFSHVISSGNEAVLCAADYLEFLIDDVNTKVIGSFAESIKQPERYVALLDRAADRGKPVVVLKAGKSDRVRRAIATHTGSIAGEATVFSAILKAHRAIEVNGLDEMSEVLAVCQGSRWPAGRRQVVLSGSGGLSELVLDVATEAGLDLSPLPPAERLEVESVVGTITGDGNPLDAWGSGNPDANFSHALVVLGRSSSYDAVVMVSEGTDHQPLNNSDNHARDAKMIVAAAAKSEKPFYLLAARSGVFRSDQQQILREAGAVVIGGIRPGLGAVDKMAHWAVSRPGVRPTRMSGDGLVRMGSGRPTIHEYDAKQLLSKAGVPTVAEQLASSLADATRAASEIGYPVVLKVISDDIAHKSEFGLVKVGINGPDQLEHAWKTLDDRVFALSSRPAIAGFLVQKMVPSGVEFIIGVTRDADFGLVMAVGIGGIFVEIARQIALRPLPLHNGDAEAMLAELPAATSLLAGARGAKAADSEALCSAIYAVADFAFAEREHLDGLDVNPLKVLPSGEGCFALDALIVPRTAGR